MANRNVHPKREFFIHRVSAGRPEVEVREKLTGETRGRLLVVFLGKGAEQSAHNWVERDGYRRRPGL